MTTRFAEINTNTNEVIRVIEQEDIINGVDVKNNKGDTSAEQYLSTIVSPDSYYLASNGGVYPNVFWKQSMNLGETGNWRRKVANISDIWNPENETFTSQKGGSPSSFVLNSDTGLYEPPTAFPAPTAADNVDGLIAGWDESNQRFVLKVTFDGEAVKYWDGENSMYIDI